LFLVLGTLTGLAQPQFTVVGTGVTYNTTTSYPAPYGNFYYGAKHQLLVTAAELTAVGITPSTLSAIGFDVYATNGVPPHVNFTVKIYTTTAANPLGSAYHTTGLVATSTPSNY